MGIAIWDARALSKQNQAAHEVLTGQQQHLQRRCLEESGLQERARRRAQDEALVPFQAVFARLRNVDLAELAAFDTLPSGAVPPADVRSVRLSAAGLLGAVVGGAATGAAAGAGAFALAGSLVVASTGTAISALSGAAATSATLAWFGGGSVAAGGGGVAAGTMVVTGIVAAPVVLVLAGFVEYKGRQERRQQQEVAAHLRHAEAQLRLEQVRVDTVLGRGRQVREMLASLRVELVTRLPELEQLVTGNDNYATYTGRQRRSVANAVAVATSLVAVLGAPFVDDRGYVTDLSAEVLADTSARLETLQAA